MSLKEWKNNEINSKLMKKWGFLKESKEEITEDSEGEETDHYGEDEGHDERELRDLERRHATRAHIDALKRDMGYDEDHERRRERGTDFREGMKYRAEDAKEESGLDKESEKDPADFTGTRRREKEAAAALEKGKGLEEGDPLMKLTPKGHRDTETSSDKRLDYEKDPAAHMTQDQALKLGLSPDTVRSAVDWDPTAEHPDDRRDTRQHSRGGHAVGLGTARRRWRKAFAGQFKEGKISVKEAKQITRQIIERIRKEGK